MHRTTKGAFAAGAAAALLLGGMGSLAYWTDTEDVPGGAVNAGEMKLVADDTNTGCGDWTLDDGESVPSTYSAGNPLVPGDVLTKVCTFTVQATGNHLRATVGISDPAYTGTGTLSEALVADATFTVDGETVTEITEDDDDEVLRAEVTVEFLADSDNSTQLMTDQLANLTITATQVHS
jgi:alternate signal-mediated exported protein